MNRITLEIRSFSFLIMLVLGTACNETVKNDPPKVQEHPKLIKTAGNTNVQCGLQDKAGNLWFGTSEDGLFEYDGRSFNQFTTSDGLCSNKIFCLLEDQEGKIWIGTEEGLSFYDGKTFTTVQIPLAKNLLPNKNPAHQKQWIHSLLEAKNGALWFLTTDGAYVYDGNLFTHFPIDEAPNGFRTSNDKAERILEDVAGNIWFGSRTNEGVFRYDGNSITKFELPEIIQNENEPMAKPQRWGWPQLQDKSGNIWFSSWGGAYRFDGRTFTSYSSKDGLPNEVTRIIEDKKGNLWFGASDGLRLYDGKTFTLFKDGLTNPWIWEILEDKNGNLWVGTRGTGLYLFDGTTFTDYTANKY